MTSVLYFSLCVRQSSVHASSFLCVEVDVSDAAKTAEAFLKISSVYKEENNEVKNAVLDSIGETLC